jgi:hypothetical protein
MAQAKHGQPRRLLPVAEPPKLLLELEAKDGHNIIAACVSPNGTRIAYSTIAGTRVFRVQTDEHDTRCNIERVKGLSTELGVAHAMQVAADNSLLVVRVSVDPEFFDFFCTTTRCYCPVEQAAVRRAVPLAVRELDHRRAHWVEAAPLQRGVDRG